MFYEKMPHNTPKRTCQGCDCIASKIFEEKNNFKLNYSRIKQIMLKSF